MHVCVCERVCRFVHLNVVLVRPEECVRSPAARVTGSYECVLGSELRSSRREVYAQKC